MQIPRFFVEPNKIDTSRGAVSLDHPLLLTQLTNVLRFRGGEKMIVLDGRGNLFRCTLDPLDRQSLRRERHCTARIDSQEKATGEPAIDLTVALPVLKSGRFEWALEKMVELGVSRIVPLMAQRAVVQLDGAGPQSPQASKQQARNEQKLSRWHTIAREAAEQCERALIPKVVAPASVKELLESSASEGATALICAERSGAPLLADLLANAAERPASASLVVLIGPEGGFTENEFEIAQKSGAKPVTLGPRILRSETAAVHATSLIIGLLDKR